MVVQLKILLHCFAVLGLHHAEKATIVFEMFLCCAMWEEHVALLNQKYSTLHVSLLDVLHILLQEVLVWSERFQQLRFELKRSLCSSFI